MAALPSPTQVAGSHSALYEAYWNQIDPNGAGTVGAIAAARFLKRSGLSDVVLSRVWDLSDPAGRGCLDKAGLFVALKLVSLAQAGRDLNMVNISLETAPPKMGDPPPKLATAPAKPPPPVSAPTPIIPTMLPSTGDWSIKPSEREKYDKLFESLKPANGMIPGNKVKGVLMESKLPLDTLGKIWDLADIDKDGMLDRHEFVVAMHLVYKALEKHAIPAILPPELMPPSKRPSPIPQPVAAPIKPPPPVLAPLKQPQFNAAPLIGHDVPQQPVAAVPWVVSSEDRAKYDPMFTKADVDKDGFVNGFEIKDVFLQSGVPQHVLALIWALCDIKQTGKLNIEQFALAMWLINRQLQNIDPPPALTPDMVPPSMRTVTGNDATIIEGATTVTPYSNPELDMISKDIDELAREKLALETDIAQKEADIKIKGGEIKSLQSELDTLTAALKQLENQKGEAQKRLNDLKVQRVAVETELADMVALIDAAKDEVEKLRAQADEQEATLRGQEGEVAKRREELETLKQEQAKLENEKSEQSKKLESLTETLTESQLLISQAKAKITQLQEQQRQMKDAITSCDIAIESENPSLVADTTLRITPEFRNPEFTRIATVKTLMNSNNQDSFSNQNDVNAGFDDDPFKADPFKNSNANDAFGGPTTNDPFTSSFPTKASDGFSSDPFDAFGNTNSNSNNQSKSDPFDPFGDKNRNATKSPAVDSEKDPFGCDPFAILHAPTRDGTIQPGPPGRPTSPSPALPPKKGKTPPPRPAPPRPVQGPTGRNASLTNADPFISPSTQHDPFAGSGAGGFADFADFDAKFSKQSSAASTTKPASSAPQKPAPSVPKFEFTDDPFRDYRYEDPFNIADPFDDEPPRPPTRTSSSELTLKSSNNLDAFGFDTGDATNLFDTDNVNKSNNNSGRISAPIINNNNRPFDPFASKNGRASAQDTFFSASNDLNDAFTIKNSTGFGNNAATLNSADLKKFHNRYNNNANNSNKSKLFSEDQQMAWAAAESVRAEAERKQRQAAQEQADLELALALSKAETKS